MNRFIPPQFLIALKDTIRSVNDLLRPKFQAIKRKRNFIPLIIIIFIVTELLIFSIINFKIKFEETIYIAEPIVPKVLIDQGIDRNSVITKLDSYLKELDKTHDFAKETKTFHILPRSFFLSTVAFGTKLFQVNIDILDSNFFEFLQKKLFNSKGVVSSRLIQSSEGYLIKLSFEGVESNAQIHKEINERFYQDIAVSIFSAVKPCKAFFYRFHAKSGENPNHLIGRCEDNLSEQMGYIAKYFEALESTREDDFQRSKELLLQVLEEHSDFSWGIAELSYVSIELYAEGRLDKNDVILTLQNNKKKIIGHPEEAYFNGYLHALLGENEKAIEEFRKYLSENENDQFVRMLVGILDQEHGIKDLRENENNEDLMSQIILGAKLSNDGDKLEGTYFLKKAAKSGSLFAAFIKIRQITQDSFSVSDFFKKARNWLGTEELSSNPYAKFLGGSLNLLKDLVYCEEKYQGSEFQEAYKLFPNYKHEDAMAHLFPGVIYSIHYSELYDLDTANYHYVAAHKFSWKLNPDDRKIFDLLVNLFGLGQEPNVSKGIDVLRKMNKRMNTNPFLSSLNKQIMPFIQNEENITKDAMNLLVIVDALKLSSPGSCALQPGADNFYSNHGDDSYGLFVGLQMAQAKRFYSGQKRDFTVAFLKFAHLALNGENEAMYFLALMYSNGHGVAQDCTKARYWLSAAIEAGSEIAKHTKLGKCPVNNPIESIDTINKITHYQLM